MAELAADLAGSTGLRLGMQQFAAILWLRWRILANSLRRRGGVGELIGRILLLPFLACLVVVPTVAAGFAAWYLTQNAMLGRLSLLLWAAFVLTQLLNINLGQPGTTFDPTELIRFPMRLRTYIAVRLFFGVLSPANIVVSLISVAAFVGITVSQPRLWWPSLLAMGAFGLANVLFSRMIFAWVDRWLSTRRAREIFTGLVFAASLGFQYLNVTYNPGFHQGRSPAMAQQRLHRAQKVMAELHPWLQWLPPELSASAVSQADHGLLASSVTDSCVVLLYAALFLAVYSGRMRTEYQGENLSDTANVVGAAPKRVSAAPVTAPAIAAFSPPLLPGPARSLLPPSLGPQLAKELLVLRRNTGLLYGVLAPTLMVFLFAGRLSLRGGTPSLLLLAVGYALLGLAPLSYNTFGLEGPGAQFYFMSPVPLRDVFFAKNVMHFLTAAFEVCTVIGIVAYMTGRPRFTNVLFVMLWAMASLLLNTTVGNLRSISAPKKINPGKTLNRAQSQLSVWIAIGILAGCAGIGVGIQFLGSYLHLPWLALVLMVAFAFGAAFAYDQGLRGIEAYALDRRESLFEELGKKT